ncbi:PDD2L protein, partial [Amia calva]|nr:PDD2L protein [Amia calva]
CCPSLSLRRPCCWRCGAALAHVVQVYCPLEASPYHRTLNVFSCPSAACSGKSDGWKVLRSQCLETENKPSQEHDAKKEVLMAAKDWCDGADDWGMDEDQGSTGLASAPPCDAALTPSQSVSVESDFNNRLQGLSLGDGTPGPVETTTEGLVLPGPVPAFQSYYISVVEEGELCPEEDMDHAQRLLKEYQKREGIVVEDLVSCDAGQEVEKYEKAKVRHGDEVFLKFMKKISLCPEQILRYCWNGEPLFITAPPSNVKQMVPPCSCCGSPRTFEMQLMPALVSMLKSANSDDLTVEFGTVLIYTCKNSCWPSGTQAPVEEFSFVQPDPDQKFFK